MITCVPALAFSHGRRRAFALGVACLAASVAARAGVARADEPVAPASAAAVDVAPLLAKATKALGGKRWRDAKKAAESVLAVDAANVDGNAVLGLADKGLGDCKDAREPLRAAFAGKTTVPGVARALAMCLGDKTADKQALAEARLAEAREAAGAGHGAEANELYAAALGAALLTQPVTRELPDDASAEAAATPAAEPPPAAAPAPARPEADDAEAAAALERAKAEAAAAAAKQKEEDARRAPPPVAPVVVVAAPAPPPPPSFPPAIQVGLRSGVSTKDINGAHRSDDVGLVFTWLTFAAPHSRAAIVFDLESTRWQSARESTTDRSATAFYGLGLDWSFPFLRGGIGPVVGLEAMGGVLQSTAGTTVSNGVVAQLMPHVGAVAMIPKAGVGVFLDAGYRLQLFTESSLGKADESGFVFQGGLRVEMKEGDAAPSGLEAGYTARVYAPNGSNIYTRYGGLPATNSKGPLLGHELTLTTDEHAPPGAEHGLAVTYVGSARASGPSLQMFGVGYVFTQHAFRTRQLLNPYLGAQLGVVFVHGDDDQTFSESSSLGAVGTLRAGLDVDVARHVLLRGGFAYDYVRYTNDLPNGSLSGYAVEAGAIVRL